jgi:6-phospho-3-hexuloisomerase
MMEAIAMRLMHAGFPSYVVGEMVTTPVRQEGVFLASAGPGHFPTIETLLKVARDACHADACGTSSFIYPHKP